MAVVRDRQKYRCNQPNKSTFARKTVSRFLWIVFLQNSFVQRVQNQTQTHGNVLSKKCLNYDNLNSLYK